VCVVGAGPHGLAVTTHLLSADPSLRDRLVVVDADGRWLSTWHEQFARLEIDVLRSPVVHHPDVDPGQLAHFTTDHRLLAVRRDGNRLAVELRNEFTGAVTTRVVDQVVTEHGTVPADELYFALRPGSLNDGELDLEALVEGRPQQLVRNEEGRYRLYRVGDAVASRNIHAAIYDSLRLCKDF